MSDLKLVGLKSRSPSRELHAWGRLIMSCCAVGQAGGDRCHATRVWLILEDSGCCQGDSERGPPVSRCQGTRITCLATGSGVYQHPRRTKRPSYTITSSPCHRLFFPVVPVAIMPLPACSRSISSFISQPVFSVPGCPPMGRGLIRTQEGWWKHVDDEIRGILPRRRPGTAEREAFMSVAICPICPQSGFGEIE